MCTRLEKEKQIPVRAVFGRHSPHVGGSTLELGNYPRRVSGARARFAVFWRAQRLEIGNAVAAIRPWRAHGKVLK
jgi:hypothetical protein